jgi:hypothetical protein
MSPIRKITMPRSSISGDTATYAALRRGAQ